MTNSELLLIVACVLFCVAGVVRVVTRSIDGACVAFGLAAAALAFIIL